jgi:hypothetical protein
VLERVRAAAPPKAVALVGYDVDAAASEASRRLPYGHRGDGIEEIVFVRVGEPSDEIVQFEDDAWPGEDRTYVQDDLDAAIELVVRFAVEYDPLGSVVLVTGNGAFLGAVAQRFEAR